MKHNLILLAAWLNADPRRVKTVSIAVLAVMVIAGIIIPGVTFAGDATSGGG